MDDTPDNKVMLFLYGTLKRGQCRDSVIKGRFIGVAKTAPNFTLFTCGPFPAMIDVSKQLGCCDDKTMYTGVVGELWEVDESLLDNRLDGIEGVPYLYNRAEVPFVQIYTENMDDSRITSAISYLYQQSVDKLAHIGESW